MSMTETTDLEKTSLEAHVGLCAMRYHNLDTRLLALESKMEIIQRDIIEGQKSLKGTIIASSFTLLAGLVSVVATILLKF